MIYFQPSHLQDVRKFRETSGLPVSDRPIMLSKSAIQHHVSLMQEEVDEFNEATDLVGKIDAVIDCYYFALGMQIHSGCPHFESQEFKLIEKQLYWFYSWIEKTFDSLVPDALNAALIFDQLFTHVHNSNMSKFCKSEAEAIIGVDKYFKQGKEVRAVRVNDLWVLKHYNGEQTKVLKGINFTPPEFEIEKTLRAYGLLKENLPLEAAKIADDEQS